MKPCACQPSPPYWQTATDGTHQRVTETIHRLGCDVGLELYEGESE